MKKLFLIHCLLSVAYCAFTQSVGVGTTSPNASAQLDVTSSTKGFLMPRMTSTQRLAISSPVGGLMVYDTDRKLFYQYDGSTWRLILNNDFWNRASSTSNFIVNLGDSIGINTTSPTQRLDVNGNIRSRNDIIADNTITATGNIGAGSFSTSGNITASGNISLNGTSFLAGDVTTNSDLIINNTTATLQLKSSSVNKGFFQLSGDNVRFGTNSGNAGSLIIRMNGGDRITFNSSGDMNFASTGSKINRPATGTFDLLPIAYGRVAFNATSCNCTPNVTVTKVSTGIYDITASSFSIYTTIVITMNEWQGGQYYVPFAQNRSSPNEDVIRVYFYHATASSGFADAGFSFIAYR